MKSIKDPTKCDGYCSWQWGLNGHATTGDVRYCKHGIIWYCYGNDCEYYWQASGFWTELHPFWNWRLWPKAREALGEFKPQT